jgi:hypothetical protein
MLYETDVYFQKQKDKKSFFYLSPLPHSWAFDFLSLSPSISQRKVSCFCHAAMELTKYLTSTEEYKILYLDLE